MSGNRREYNMGSGGGVLGTFGENWEHLMHVECSGWNVTDSCWFPGCHVYGDRQDVIKGDTG